uniref:Uncharacterized protein TCIL3000_11_6610 n=1 Tax=Trypanosoma congolense (strain IL3000) TaxID=1068625 RepID=G0V0R4_TRYCI|nr:unnamed protein product [Trypanosoma congolense IL3000]
MGKDVDVAKLTSLELQAHVERCERLLKHPSLLSRLPDGGSEIVERRTRYLKEIERRESSGEGGISTGEAARESSDGNGGPGTPTPQVEMVAENGDVRLNKAPLATYEEEARVIGERYRHSKVPVEAIVRRTFGGSLCEAEIQRILSDVPHNFFLTHDETIRMERRLMEEERAEMLRRLQRQQLAPTGSKEE